ncbi:hypothetical protein Tco_0548298 [Tanacetum coccineum]
MSLQTRGLVFFSKRRNTEDVYMDDGPSSLKKWKDKLLLIDRGAVLDYLTWRHSCSCVSNDLPSDGYDQNNMQRLGAHLICLREIREEVLVCSGLSSVWFNNECDLCFAFYAEMSIYDFMTLPSCSDAKIVEESHHLSLPLLEHVPLHTTAPAMEGVIIPLPTPDEIAASLPDSCLAKKSKGPSLVSRPSKKRKLQKRASKAGSSTLELDQAEGVDEADLADLCAENEDRLERDEGVPTRAVSAPTPRLCKRLGAPPSAVVVSGSEPSHVGTSAPASTSGRSLSLGVACGFLSVVVSGRVGKSGTEVSIRWIRWIVWFAVLLLAMRSMIKFQMMILAPLRGEEIDLTLKALDRTITPAELRRTESLLLLELSNHVNVLSAMSVSHGYELNSRYTNLVSSRARLKEKLDQKKGDASEEVKKLQSQLSDAKVASVGLTEELTRTDDKLSKQALTVRDLQNKLALEKFKSQGYKDAMDGLREEWGLRMGQTDVEFEAAVQKVSNFYVGAMADFDKALVDFPITPLLRLVPLELNPSSPS